MSETIANLANKNSRNALQRVEELEKAVPQLVQAINEAITKVNNQLAGLTEIMDAVIQLLGADQVQKTVLDARQARDAAEAAELVNQTNKLVEDGVLAKVDAVSEKSVLVFKETTPTGALVRSRSQYVFSALQEGPRAQFLGKAVGEKFTPENGNVFELVEIFDIIKNPVAEPTPVVAAEPSAEAGA